MDTTMVTVQTVNAPPIPMGCICSYTWHRSGDGRSVRNGALKSCPADHTAIDEAASLPQPPSFSSSI